MPDADDETADPTAPDSEGETTSPTAAAYADADDPTAVAVAAAVAAVDSVVCMVWGMLNGKA